MQKAHDSSSHESCSLSDEERENAVAEEQLKQYRSQQAEAQQFSDDSDDGEHDDHEDIRFDRLKSFQEPYYPELELVVHPSVAQDEHPDAHLNHNPDVIIIGAGPVGLWTAIQIKVLRPELDILLLEKHQVYQRNHLLRLVKSSLKLIHSDSRLEDFKKLAGTLTGKIRTSELERSLWKKAESLGIKKEYMEVKDVIGLKKMFSNLKIIIGADGSHSLVRKQIFGDKLSVKETIEHVAFVKYDAEGKAEGLNMKESYCGMKLMHHLIYENVGKCTEGQSPITLQIKIDGETYKKMEGCKFKTPYNLTSDKPKIDEKLFESVTIWLNMRKKFNNEKRVKDSAKVTTVNLDVYRAEQVAKGLDDHHVAVFLCGDSACGVPFFRALNNGMLCGSMLAGLLFDYKERTDKVMKKYNESFSKLADKEIRKAKRVTWAHYLAESAVRFNAKVPWQFISLKKVKKELLAPLPENE